ncbi:MAG TPA: hypothetical protein G4O03_08270 [Dehalococcoidia bacterium]|nr:hypothetical protein [Dehalococcoidia bacterium]
MRLKILGCILLIFALAIASDVDPKAAIIKSGQELASLEMRHAALNIWWNVYIARERVPYYEAPLIIDRIEHYKSRLQALNTELIQIHAPGELAYVRQLLSEVYAKRLTYCTLSIKYYSLRDEQALSEADRIIDEANHLHGKAQEQLLSVLDKYGISLEEIIQRGLKPRLVE